MFNQLSTCEAMLDNVSSGASWTQQGTLFEPWQPWFAWRIVQMMDGSWVWLRNIYRRAYAKDYTNHDDWTQYQYGTILDVIANPDQPDRYEHWR